MMPPGGFELGAGRWLPKWTGQAEHHELTAHLAALERVKNLYSQGYLGVAEGPLRAEPGAELGDLGHCRLGLDDRALTSHKTEGMLNFAVPGHDCPEVNRGDRMRAERRQSIHRSTLDVGVHLAGPAVVRTGRAQ